MRQPDFTMTKANGDTIDCYGVLEETSNISVVCVDECDDGVWTIGNPITGQPFTTWAEVIYCLHPYFRSGIVELGAV